MPATTPQEELVPRHDVEPPRSLRLPSGELRNKRDREGAEITTEQVGEMLSELKELLDPALAEIVDRSPAERLEQPGRNGETLVHTLRNGGRLSVTVDQTAGDNRGFDGRPYYAHPRLGREVSIGRPNRTYRDERLLTQPLPIKDRNAGDKVYPRLLFMDDGDVMYYEHTHFQKDNGWYSIGDLSPRDAMTLIGAVKAGIAEHVQALDHPDSELEPLPLSPGQTEVVNPISDAEQQAAETHPVGTFLTSNRFVRAMQRLTARRQGHVPYSPYPVEGAGHEGRRIDLITPDHFRALPVGTELIDAHTGETVIKGEDVIDFTDTRYGGVHRYSHYGFPTRLTDDQNKPYFGPRRTR